MASNYQLGLYNELLETKEALAQERKLNQQLREENKGLKQTIDELKQTIQSLRIEINRLKNIIEKDSSNSSKPSSTNGYKKVVSNNRKPSHKKPGKPKGFSSTNLSEEKVQKLIDSGDVEMVTIEVNKNKKNQNKPYRSVRVIDIKVVKQIIEYRYYPDEDGNYSIPEYHNRSIQYGSNIKAITNILMNEVYNSTDGVCKFIGDITNGGIELSKSTLIRWNKELAKKLEKEITEIETQLLNSYYINHDESQIKINGDGYNDLCASNSKYTRLWIHKHKSHDALKEIGFLPQYQGIIVKDGTELYNGFGAMLAQCICHIQRYLKGIYTKVEHSSAKKMDEFLSTCIHERKEKIKAGVLEYTKEELHEKYQKYDDILKKWKKEWMYSDAIENPVYDDERKLLSRMEDDDKKEILYFLEDFKIPATNNQAESDQRNIKIKQKIGKFRCVEGAENYAVIRSCINTYKKQDINVLKAIISAFENNPVII